MVVMTSITITRTLHVLLVEDNPGDARLTMEALKERRSPVTVDVVTDGVEALRYLRNEGEYSIKPRPDLVFLDLNLPKMDGREVLKEVKKDERIRQIPILILSTSSDEKDIAKAYENYANSYFVKPMDFDAFIELIRTIENCWLCAVALPKAEKD